MRVGAAAVITDARGRVLVFEREKLPGAWQFPQGGLEDGEEPEAAVLREVHEETGLVSQRLEPVAVHPEWLAYELPPALRSAKTGRGQVHRWFLFRLRGADDAVTLPPVGEFRAWQWVELADAVRLAAPFRRPVYERVAAWCAPLLRSAR